MLTLISSLLKTAAMPALASDVPAQEEQQPVQFTLSNDDLQLNIDTRLTGLNRLTDKIAGEHYDAAAFGVLRAYDSTEDRVRVLVLAHGQENLEFNLEQTDQKSAVLHIHQGGAGEMSPMCGISTGISFDVSFQLAGNALEIAIPFASLQERMPERFRVQSIEILPRLGATPAGNPGYLFIPSWSGGVYYFDRGNPRANPDFATTGKIDINTEGGLQSLWGQRPDAPAEYGSLVYGIQAAWEDQLQLPVYGTIRANAGLGGLCLGGAFDTQLLASRNQGPAHCAAVYPRWIFRHLWHSKLDSDDRRIRLVALRGEAASYSGLANLCRECIIADMGAQPLKARAENNAALKYYIESCYVNAMFGMLRKNEKGLTVCRTYQSFDDFRDSLALFDQAGFKKVSMIFVGANILGHDGAHPSIFPIEYQHGGQQKFQELIAAVNTRGWTCCVHANYKDCYLQSPDWDEGYIQTNEYGELRFHGAWMGGWSYQGLPHEMHRRFARRDLPRLRDMGMRGFHYFDAIGSVMEETFAPGQRITRREYCEGMLGYIKEAEEIFGCVGTETYIAPLLGTICNVGHCYIKGDGNPITDGANGYSTHGLIDHFVPVQMMAIHGLCLYGGGPETAGRAGQHYWKKPTAETVKELWERYQECQQWSGDLDYEFFVDHRYLAPRISRSSFSDGTVIWVNHSDQPYAEGELQLEPKGYRVDRPAGS